MEQSGEASRGEDGRLQERLGGWERRSNTAKKISEKRNYVVLHLRHLFTGLPPLLIMKM